MKKYIIISSLLLALFFLIFNVFSNDKKSVLAEIDFLSNKPLIDGLQDNDIIELPFRKFDSKFNIHFLKGSLNSQYKLAYGNDFLYVYIEAEADSFVCKDRGYQNGDGFILTIAKPELNNEPTNEFYTFGFSAQKDPKQMWAEKVIWNYNNKVILSSLDDNVELEHIAKDGKISFELLLPWKEVYPHHPILSQGIGINLWFMKAFPGKSFPNSQGILLDMGMGSEHKPCKYKLLEFEKPETQNHSQSYVTLDKNHCQQGEQIKIKSSILTADKLKMEMSVSIYKDKKDLGFDSVYTSSCEQGINIKEFEFNTYRLQAGNYELKFSFLNSNESQSIDLTVLPKFDYNASEKELGLLENKISKGSYSTLQFYLNDINKSLGKLYKYETCSQIVKDIKEVQYLIKELQIGNDVLEEKTGEFRRSFLSRIDSTYQPYTVKIPDNFDKNKKYPLIVFLHGSGRTDKDMFKYHKYLSKGKCIQIAPKARGTSNYYSTDKAQVDIQEAINDVISNYNIDTSRILLTGFSMGGYGVYRTYLETPDRYKALAVFSGEPRVSFFYKRRGGDYINFLKKKNLKDFNKIPIFIYHGKKDLNCPFELTKEFVTKLQSINSNITFITDDFGHGISKNRRKLDDYHDWLDNQFK